jgi:hypothetical protein
MGERHYTIDAQAHPRHQMQDLQRNRLIHTPEHGDAVAHNRMQAQRQ